MGKEVERWDDRIVREVVIVADRQMGSLTEALIEYEIER